MGKGKKMTISCKVCRCKYCGKEIRWFKRKSGKPIPCEPWRVCYKIPEDGNGSETIITLNGDIISADKVWSNNAEGVGYITHFAACQRNQAANGEDNGGDTDGSRQHG